MHGRTCLLVALLVLLVAAPALAGTLDLETKGVPVTVSPPDHTCQGWYCSYDIAEGTEVTFTAEPEWAGFEFSGWSGCLPAGPLACKLTMGPTATVVAHSDDVAPPNILEFYPGVLWPYTANPWVLTWNHPVYAEALDSQSGVERVRLLLDGRVLAVDETDTFGWTGYYNLTPVGPPPPDGPATLTLEVTDKAGHVATRVRPVVVDASGPAISFGLSGPSWRPNVRLPGHHTIGIEVKDPHDVETVACKWDGASVDCPAGEYDTRSVAVNVTEGVHHLQVDAADTVGNSSYAYLQVRGDDGPPDVAITSGPKQGERIAATGKPGHELASVTFGVTANDLAGARFECAVFRAFIPSTTPKPCGGRAEPSIGPPLTGSYRTTLTAGRWVFRTSAIDGLGQRGRDARIEFVVDPAPGVPFLRPIIVASFSGPWKSRRGRIVAKGLPRRATATLRCDGPGCLRKFTRLPVRRGRADAERALKGGTSLKGISGIELRIAAPGWVGRLIVWDLNGPEAPARSEWCLSPGATIDRPCWD